MLAAGLAFTACLGMTCVQEMDPPGLPAPRLTSIGIKVTDPGLGASGAALAWTYSGDRVSYFEIYRSLKLDSLLRGSPARSVAAESSGVLMPLPDSARPFTLYFAVRAVWIEPTGQKTVSDSALPDSLTLNPSLDILQPAAGSVQAGRRLDIQVLTQSESGVTLRMHYFEKRDGAWSRKLDTCLPMDACGLPIFGHSQQQESLTLEQPAAADTIPAMFCLIGTESFEGRATGMAQSLGCKGFLRVAGP
jgi:hypothetical protein